MNITDFENLLPSKKQIELSFIDVPKCLPFHCEPGEIFNNGNQALQSSWADTHVQWSVHATGSGSSPFFFFGPYRVLQQLLCSLFPELEVMYSVRCESYHGGPFEAELQWKVAIHGQRTIHPNYPVLITAFMILYKVNESVIRNSMEI
ncbi:hypothetical protein CEXT_646331 [Caerostris extrusa]|uniref:Uncharacterized protein n=1 Tax=Caerostris extrusa TaxID=172846 RepID=A0AAV4M9G8_CAEEX|nr:hypothetical protein CEXT_646331 [Caerostris extrusa]